MWWLWKEPDCTEALSVVDLRRLPDSLALWISVESRETCVSSFVVPSPSVLHISCCSKRSTCCRRLAGLEAASGSCRQRVPGSFLQRVPDERWRPGFWRESASCGRRLCVCVALVLCTLLAIRTERHCNPKLVSFVMLSNSEELWIPFSFEWVVQKTIDTKWRCEHLN